MITRQEKILSCIDPANQIGLEIGALSRPIVTREMGEIRYVDYASTEDLKRKYANDQNVETEAIVDVNYIWGSQTLPELVGSDAPFDYVIASHVIEHVPDLIGWLKEIHAVLKPGGILALAIPDKRYCFDYCRQLTQSADVIEAYLQHRRRPSARQIFDHFSSNVSYRGAGNWAGEIHPDELVNFCSLEQAFNLAKHSLETETYIDTHCWVLTPTSFFQLLKTLIDLNLFGFQVEKFHNTEGGEFHVSLVAVDLTKDPDTRQAIQLDSLPIDSEQFLSAVDSDEFRLLKVKLQQEQEHLTRAKSKLKVLRADKQRLKEKVECLQSKVTALKAELAATQSSKFWKLRSQWMRLKQTLNLKL